MARKGEDRGGKGVREKDERFDRPALLISLLI